MYKIKIKTYSIGGMPDYYPPLETIAAARRFLRSLRDGELELLGSYVDSDAVMELHYGAPLPIHGPVVTRADLLQHCLELEQHVHIQKNQWTIFLCQGERIAVYGLSTFVSPSGANPIDAGACSWMRFVDGQFVSGHSFYDSAVLHQLLPAVHETGIANGWSFQRALGSMLNLSGELYGPPSEDFSQLLAGLTQLTDWRGLLGQLLDSKVQWCGPLAGGKAGAHIYSDAEAVLAAFEAFDAVCSSSGLRILEYIQAEDTLALRAEALVASRLTGNCTQLPLFMTLTLRDGQLVRGFEVCDTLRLQGLHAAALESAG